MPFIQFAKRYTRVAKAPEDTPDKRKLICQDNLINEDFVISPDPKQRRLLPRFIELSGDFVGKERSIVKLRKPIVARLHQWKKDTEPHNWYYSELELYHCFKSKKERQECRDSLDRCKEVYDANIEDIKYRMKKAMPYKEHIDEGQNAAAGAFNEEIGELLDPEGTQAEADCLHEGVDEPDKFVAFDYDVPPAETSGLTDRLFKRVELTTRDRLLEQTRALDPDQRVVVEKVVDYIKAYKKAKLNGQPLPKPFYAVVVGGAGSGKSHVIHIIEQWVELEMRDSGTHLDHPFIIKCAFAGCAAANVGGQTLHSSFSFDFHENHTSLNDKTRDMLAIVMGNLIIVIVDEFSMVKSNHIYMLDARLREIKHRPDDMFGGASIILYGDPLQLKPVGGGFPWTAPSKPKFLLTHAVKPIWPHFQSIELKTNHRQNEDGQFADILNRIRKGVKDAEDIRLLRSRVVPTGSDLIPRNSIYIFATNTAVNDMNDRVLDTIDEEEHLILAITKHPRFPNFKPKVEKNGNIKDTGLQERLRLKVGCKVMITCNLLVSDGLTNGTMGELCGYQFDTKGNIVALHVHLYSPTAGEETAQSSEAQALTRQYGKRVIPIVKYEARHALGYDRQLTGASATSYQFPIRVAEAVTAHKVKYFLIKIFLSHTD